MCHCARHGLNARNVINWKRNFMENIIKKYLGERITKEVVVLKNEAQNYNFEFLNKRQNIL